MGSFEVFGLVSGEAGVAEENGRELADAAVSGFVFVADEADLVAGEIFHYKGVENSRRLPGYNVGIAGKLYILDGDIRIAMIFEFWGKAAHILPLVYNSIIDSDGKYAFAGIYIKTNASEIRTLVLFFK